ncbi:MAG: universal stress protein [Candidatus Rokubacteria bacterium]|nr:universal stress protein [Candidatus Rokubacteria bacterium]
MRVLLATDGSKDACAAAEYLKHFPLPGDAAIRVMTVVTLPPSALDVPPVAAFNESLLAEGRRVVGEACALLGPRAAVEERVVQGNPKEEIVRAAEEWPADLVVVGGRGLGGVRGFLLGSVSQTVARHVHCPVLVVKGRARALASVLIATDGSDGANEAIRFLLSLPFPPAKKVRVRLLSAVEPTPYPASAPKLIRAQLKGMIAQLERERRADVEKVLDRAARELKAKVTRLTRSMPTGHPAREIVAAAASCDADLVVVGARGLGGMKRLLLGSVSERVLHDARCPVLIVKGTSRT